jgi:fatty-acyl-CoA synthase
VFNLAHLHEAIAERVPLRECLVFRDRRLSWRDVTLRSRRLASLLRARLGAPTSERGALANWESGQAHVGLYLYNGNEYLESMLGAFKARAVPVNVNYRYVEEELLYLFRDAKTRALIYHASFAPVLARIRSQLSGIELWLQVADESGEPLLPGALDYEAALAASPADAPQDLSPDDLYALYTGGTTGMPKGVLWRQEDICLAALYTRPVASAGELVARAERGRHRALPAPPFMHGAAHWAAFNTWLLGGTVVVQSDPRRLDPHDIWSTVARERVSVMTIVGDAFARPLADALRAQRYDLAALEVIGSGGAILTAALKTELLERLPHVRIADQLGSSESGSQAIQVTRAGARASTGDFEIANDNLVLREDLTGAVAQGSAEIGWLARRGRVPLGYYGDREKTQRTFPVIGGVRYAVPGDRAALEQGGKLRLLGRDAVTINTGGEKVFAEEVEHALKHHPAVLDAVVVGTPHERWGQQVTALVALRPGESPGEEALLAVARAHLAAYKLPRRFVFLPQLVRAPSGKADYRWAREAALKAPSPKPS